MDRRKLQRGCGGGRDMRDSWTRGEGEEMGVVGQWVKAGLIVKHLARMSGLQCKHDIL